MAVELTSPAEGKQAGESYSGPNEEWLVANGYATRSGDDSDNHLNTTVTADSDPTNADNREAPDAERVEYGGKKVRKSEAKNAPEVGAGEPVHIEGEEPGAARKTVHRPDLEDRAKRAEADVKGVSVEDVEGTAGDGQDVSDQEEPAQDGDSENGATSA